MCDYTRMNEIDTTYKNYSSYYAYFLLGPQNSEIQGYSNIYRVAELANYDLIT